MSTIPRRFLTKSPVLIGLAMWLGILQGLSLAQGFLIDQSAGEAHHRLPRPWPSHHPFPPHPPLPPPPPPPPMIQYGIKSLEIDAQIRNSVAQISLSQTFINEGSRVIEAKCLFPMPPGAVVQDVSMLVDGKELAGQLLSSDEAQRIYQGHLQRMRDPALVQWVGHGLLETSVFPIPPGAERTVTLRYSELLESSDGLLQWQVPLRASSYSLKPMEKVRLTAFIQQDQPLGSIYSPTHSVTTEKHTAQSATVRLESNQTVPNSNFRLLLSTGKHSKLADWLAYHPASEEPGYFLMLFHPDQAAFADPKLAESAKVPKDVVLLLDKSGSMRGAKIDQARQALLEVLEDLSPDDRFGIVVYDQVASTFRPALVEKSDATSLESARGFIRSLAATGSTNMEMGLRDALAMLEKSDRPGYVVHLSDGVPTIGQRDPRKIAAQALQWNSRKVRMFSFGVGHDVNSRLLNQLSRDGRGKTYFVAPEEPIEASVSALSQRLGQPALSDIRWELRDAAGKVLTLSEVEPAQIYDLFQGDQATIVGRYQGTGQVQLVVRGNVAGENKEWTEPINLTLPQRPQENAFIAPLWASRRVASLIDEIDLEGQTPERVKLLVDLAKRYGILTEYTAFLADETAPGASPVDRESRVVEELRRLGEESGQLGFQQRAGNRKSIEANNLSDALAAQSSSLQRGLAAKSGSGRPPGGPAGGAAGGLSGLALPGAPGASPLTDSAAPGGTNTSPSLPILQSGDRAYFQKDGQWVDSQLLDQIPKEWTSIERFSEPYFQLLSKHRDALEGVLEVELPVLVRLEGKVYRIE